MLVVLLVVLLLVVVLLVVVVVASSGDMADLSRWEVSKFLIQSFRLILPSISKRQ